ncbi:hypothetical protein JYU34_015119 [Plutella xylostella]|uniref:Uncharacterized protein n=1 Tax=Plutella xylostella TaxID=51655 RepID=A0ABQ7QA15_PLUXY|nr:hypothetical protein JYU34_015119 [Plutella xylostella]
MTELKSMGELASTPPDDEKEAFYAVIASIDAHYPSNWRDWLIHDYSFDTLFGGNHIPTAVDMKIRFAIPTTDLARAFYPSATTLSERAYRAIRHKILEWPLGRTLLYAPHSIVEKIHAPSYEAFLNTVRELKPKLVKRPQASLELAENAPRINLKPTGRKRSCETPPTASGCHSKRVAMSSSSDIQEAPTQGSNEHLLAAVLSQQTEMFNKMMLMFNQHQSGNSAQTPEKRSFAQKSRMPKESLPPFRARIVKVFDFAPTTTEKAPKIAKADPKAVKYGLDCQKLGQSGWSNVRYAELQQQFQATPVFSALKVNNVLATVTPNWKSTEILERFDMTLGAISHGLIKQRMIFQNLLDSLPKEMKERVGNDFVLADSDFRRTSDALIQYTCGR